MYLLPRTFYVYILTNDRNTVLYTGVTNNLERRVNQHKSKAIKGFTAKYNVHKLVYYEKFESIFDAIDREKQIKGGSREKKEKLITKSNPEYKDLCRKSA